MASILSKEECCGIVKNTLGTSDFKLLEIKQNPITEGEAGLLGEHYKVEATVLQQGCSDQLKLPYFIKIKPREEGIHRDLVNSTKVFEKESKFYNTLFLDLKKEHSQEGIRHDNDSFWFCSCYLSKEDMIVLEDLSASEFRMQSARIPMDYKHCAIVLKALARLHAVSIAYEEKILIPRALNLKEFYPDVFFEALWVNEKNHVGNGLCYTASKGALSLCKYMPNYGESYKHYQFIIGNLMKTFEQMYELVKPSNKFRNVICHGDLWANNIMFKYGPNGQPEDVRFIDFQLVRYCPPGHDIMMFLHLATTRKFRQTHMKELLDLYYTTFTSELALYNLKAQDLLPWTELQAGCDEHNTAALIFAVTYFQNILLSSTKMQDVTDPEKMRQILFQDKSDFLHEVFISDPLFRERISEATEELIESCILNKIKSL